MGIRKKAKDLSVISVFYLTRIIVNLHELYLNKRFSVAVEDDVEGDHHDKQQAPGNEDGRFHWLVNLLKHNILA